MATIWCYPPENQPLKIRAEGAALVEITPPAMQKIGFKTYFKFADLNLVNAMIVWAFYPKRQGRHWSQWNSFSRKLMSWIQKATLPSFAVVCGILGGRGDTISSEKRRHEKRKLGRDQVRFKANIMLLMLQLLDPFVSE